MSDPSESTESEAAAAVAAIASWPEVVQAVERAREACTRLRWHEGLRRRAPEAGVESQVRAVVASAELEGARTTADIVRARFTGAQAWPDLPDPSDLVVRAAARATTEAAHLGQSIRSTPAGALARLHTSAGLMGPGGAQELGRPRSGDQDVAEFTDLGPAPDGVAERLAGVAALLGDGGASAIVVAALVHAEIALVRPFARGNGIVARAAERAVLHSWGVDPTAVSVPEAGHAQAGQAAYVGALGAYATGTRRGLTVWIEHCVDAYVGGAAEGERIADAVRIGRLS